MGTDERAEPSAESAPPSSPRFRRTYVACDSCRARKVRCIVGDNPPCAKCKREHRDCRFDRRPKTAKHRDLPSWVGVKSASQSATSPTRQNRVDAGSSRPSTASPQVIGPPEQEDTPPEAITPSTASESYRTWANHSLQDSQLLSERVMSSFVTGSNDALDVLSDAANLLHNATVAPFSGQQPTQPSFPVRELPVAVPASMQTGCQTGVGFTILSLSEPSDATLDVWDKCRFVRQGWFTSQEAVTFFKHLSPLSPVLINQYSHHEAHTSLICQESMLCCTILMISSRFFMLPGAGGVSRSHLIHNRLWQFCESLIKRIILGQEKVSTAKMRIIGTIESLLLISDWHPRAVHFPPDTEGWDAALVDTEYDRQNRKRTNDEEPLLRWRKDVFEPAKRASRMSWMLLGLATNLAHELGIMSNDHTVLSTLDSASRRRFRAQKLLYTYMTQTATRLGYHSVFPESTTIAASRSFMRDVSDESQLSWNAYMDAYLELTRLSKVASSMFFQSITHLQNVLQNDNYPDLLEHFLESLSNWNKTFDSTLNGQTSINSLLVEFYHLKACIGAISLQAVVQRATGSEASRTHKDGLAAYMTAQDSKFLQEVVSDCSKVLHIATVTPFREHLAYSPARIRLGVISASVFLLKAISIGSPATDVHAALNTLDRCTTTLKTYPPDDMDFAMRYADLIVKHTSHLRNNMISDKQVQPPSNTIRRHEPASLDEFDLTLSTLSSGDILTDNSKLDHHEFWRALQFDSSIAPFGDNDDQLAQGFDVDSLNFLWNMPDISS
ncbi:uncharacterized protein CTRU02_203003 [Colletotrichum truncatum]|uniref:Uncharacterized protein n=1 Tax=Colletotrichum truncatum TaxID=5467 RepID=A0ACC3Z840_COLTU